MKNPFHRLLEWARYLRDVPRALCDLSRRSGHRNGRGWSGRSPWLSGAAVLSVATVALMAQSGGTSLPLRRLGEAETVEAPPRTVPDPFPEGRFEMRRGEVVAWLGQANSVREQRAGDLELELTLAWHGAGPRFRWLAWEGDTVHEQWRDLNFGSWQEQLQLLGVTLGVAQFGQMEALDGPGGVERFSQALHRLLDGWLQVTPRWVLVSPTPFERPPHPSAPDLSLRNADVALYVEALRQVARQRDLLFIDLYHPWMQRRGTEDVEGRWTDNGVHWNAAGRRFVNQCLLEALGNQASAGSEGRMQVPVDGAREQLHAWIREKNRLWFDLWRPMNWAFLYGDRTEQLFGQPDGDGRYLREELDRLRPLLGTLEDRIRGWDPQIVSREDTDVSRTGPSPVEVARQIAARLDSGLPARPVPDPGWDLSDDPTHPAAVSPGQVLSALRTHPDVVIEWVASEAEGVVNPVHMAWDHQGRLWVACTPTYPHLEPGRVPSDYVWVGTDTTGNGRIDQWHRFAEGLHMVQGVEPTADGVYICEGTELTLWRDTDGDGRGDERTVVLSGFGTGDTHQLINSVAEAPDGSLWMTQGHHVYSRVETPWGVSRLDKAGVWRYRPLRQRLDGFFPMSTAGANAWGVAWDGSGEVFHKTGDRPEGYYTVPGLIPGAMPREYHGIGSLFQYPRKTTALEFLGGSGWPEEWQGAVAVAGFMGGEIVLHQLLPNGSGFRSEILATLVEGEAPVFRPVGLREGPDGCLYVADFHNPIIGHYQHSYRDPRRDRTRGRIWRIRPVTGGVAGTDALVRLNGQWSPAAGLALLEAPDRWFRDQARRRLFHEPMEVLEPALAAWIRASTDDSMRLNRVREAVWQGSARESIRADWLEELLEAPGREFRAMAVRLMAEHPAALGDRTLERVRLAAEDPSSRVRLASVVAMAHLPGEAALAPVVEVFEKPRDRFLDYALAQLFQARVGDWLPALGEGSLSWKDHSASVAFALATVQPKRAELPGAVLYRHLCGNCHQPGGGGLKGIYPPLAGSSRVQGDVSLLVRMVIHGVQGPYEADGQRFNQMMPPSGFNDQQVADVLTYVRSQWGNNAGAVTAEEVRAVREQSSGRRRPWTLAELEAPGRD